MSMRSLCPFPNTIEVGQISMSHSTGSLGLSHNRSLCAWYGRYGSERSGSSLRCEARSQPLVTHGTGWPCWPTSHTSLPSGPMLRIVAKISMSSEVLDTQSLSTIGPVTSVSLSLIHISDPRDG